MSSETERLGRLEERLNRMDRELFGNGQPGRLAVLEAADTLLSAQVAKVDMRLSKAQWIAFGVFIAWSFLTGSGTVSLEHLLTTFGGHR